MRYQEQEDAEALDRVRVVVANFSECAAAFRRACETSAPAEAQEAAMCGLAALGRLFSERDEQAHELMLSMIGMIVASKWGRKDHILLQSAGPVEGTSKGLGHAYQAGFAIWAFNLLIDLGLSQRKARRVVAKFLADHGCSFRSDEHGLPKPATEGAVRAWCENGVQLHNEIAADLRIIHTQNMARRGIVNQDAVVAYLREEAGKVVRQAELF